MNTLFYTSVIVPFLIFGAFNLIWINYDQRKYTLVVGILSARDHFLQREIIRKGLKGYICNLNLKIVFIIANKPCEIPNEFRLNQYSCESNVLKERKNDSLLYTTDIYTIKSDNLFVSEWPAGLDFHVYNNILVREIGIYDHDEDGINSTIQVTIYDTITQQPIISSAFVSFSTGELRGKFRFKSTSEIVFKKGFKGSLIIEGLNENNPLYTKRNCSSHENHYVHFRHGYRYGFSRGVFPSHFLSNTKSSCFLAGITFSFVLIDDDLSNEKFEDITENWKNNLKEEEIKLKQENLVHGDLVYVNTVEVYRNLPRKMLEFYLWLVSLDFDFFLKTDDDTFVNINAIMNYLKYARKHYTMENIWIGNFRENFPLDLHGKWSEHEYKSLTYPPFACGSGYILSKNVVKWVANNKDYLKNFQGEDTSLGIWLASIHVHRIEHNKFECFHTSHNDSFTIPENSISELQKLYNST